MVHRWNPYLYLVGACHHQQVVPGGTGADNKAIPTALTTLVQNAISPSCLRKVSKKVPSSFPLLTSHMLVGEVLLYKLLLYLEVGEFGLIKILVAWRSTAV